MIKNSTKDKKTQNQNNCINTHTKSILKNDTILKVVYISVKDLRSNFVEKKIM